MRLLDRYVALTFLKTFLATLLVFAVSGVALDFFSRLSYFGAADRVAGTFAEEYSRGKLIFLFYLAYLPYLLKQVLPFVSVASALITVHGMMRHNEVMPVLSAGVSARRLFFPLLACGVLVSGLHFGFNEYLLPSISREHIALKRFFSGDRKTGLQRLAHLRDGKGTVTRAGSYSFADQSLRDVTIQRPWKPEGFELCTADRLDPDGDAWVATAGATILPTGILAEEQAVPPGTRIDFGVSPDEVEALASKQGTAEISLRQLGRLVDKFPYRRHLRVSFHKQITRPLTSFVLLLVAIAFLLGRSRARIVGLVTALALCAGYYFLDIFFSSLGDRGDLTPVVAAYAPLALLFSIGTARLLTMRT